MAKDLIVLCDGTGNAPEVNFVTNVQILRELLGIGVSRSRIKYSNFVEGWEIDHDTLPNKTRLVYYDRGLGAPKLDSDGELLEWSWKPRSFFKNAQVIYNKFKSAHSQVTANGIIDNVAQAYYFLVNNYEPGDKIFLFGFSRGAYTLRLLVTMIRYIGLLDKKHFDTDAAVKQAIEDGFKLYNMNVHPDANPQVKEFSSKCYAESNLIHFLGLWDTVRGLVEEEVHNDAKLSSIVEIARHAISIDEQRKIFKPELWIASEDTDSVQMWFAGVHCDIGGGYPDRGLSNISLQWMINEANKFGLQLDPQSLIDAQLISNPLAMQHDSLHAKIQDNLDLTWEFLGSYRRPIMQMTNTERLHSSVLERYGKTVKNGSDNIVYQPPILSHEFVAYNNFKQIAGFTEILAKLYVPEADALDDVGETTSLIPKP